MFNILKKQNARSSVKEIIRRHGIAEQILYRWRLKFGSMEFCTRSGCACLSEECQAEEAFGGTDAGQRGVEGCLSAKVVWPAGMRDIVFHMVAAHEVS